MLRVAGPISATYRLILYWLHRKFDVSVIGVGITTVKQACQILSLAAAPLFFRPRAATDRRTERYLSLGLGETFWHPPRTTIFTGGDMSSLLRTLFTCRLSRLKPRVA